MLSHGGIEKLTENLWRVEGTLPNMALKRVMTIAKRRDGRLVVHNAIALDEAAMKEIEAWGKPAFLIVPNGYHRLDAKAFAARYPAMQILCPKGARAKVEEVVKVSGSYEDFPSDPDVALEYVDGVKGAEGVMRVKSADGTTLVLNDVVFNMPHMPGFAGFVMRMLGSSGGPRVTRIAKMFLVKDRRACKESLEKLAATPDLRRVVVSHHQTIASAPADALRAAAASL